MIQPYTPDVSLKGKLRRRFARLTHRRPVRLNLTRPTISFTFDDIPASAGQAGASALEAQGARGTFYVCAGLFGQEGHMGRFADASEISDLIRRGHEVAGHTFDHLDCHRTPEADLTFDLDANDAALRGLGAAPIHFAYPYGEVSPRAKALSLRSMSGDSASRRRSPSCPIPITARRTRIRPRRCAGRSHSSARWPRLSRSTARWRRIPRCRR